MLQATQQSSGNSLVVAKRKINDDLVKFLPEIKRALPGHMSAERMARLAMTAFSLNPKLLECDVKSVFGAIIQASQLGLEIGVNGQAYLVPYKNICTFVPGWKGLIDLLARTGRGAAHTGAVYDGDFFEYEKGTSPKIVHRDGDQHGLGKITHVYAVGRVNGSEIPIIEVWSMARIKAHRDKYNKVGARHYSYMHEEMYARKVALLQVLKYMPSSPELSAASEYAYRAETGDSSGASVFDVDFSVNEITGEIVGAPDTAI